jgi:hypothetical protein
MRCFPIEDIFSRVGWQKIFFTGIEGGRVTTANHADDEQKLRMAKPACTSLPGVLDGEMHT